jgi:hypothetical protein
MFSTRGVSRSAASPGRLAAILTLLLFPWTGGVVRAVGPHGSAGPLSLSVSLKTTEVVIGEPVTVTYVLTNQAAEAFTGCADDWSAGVWWGHAGIRETAVPTGGSCPDEGHFKLEPHASRTWTSDVKVLNAGLGEGRFAGIVRYAGDTWSGEARSVPVPVVFRDPAPKPKKG